MLEMIRLGYSQRAHQQNQRFIANSATANSTTKLSGNVRGNKPPSWTKTCAYGASKLAWRGYSAQQQPEHKQEDRDHDIAHDGVIDHPARSHCGQRPSNCGLSRLIENAGCAGTGAASGGPTVDFILGRIFESAMQDTSQQLFEASNNDATRKIIAGQNFAKRNCGSL